MEDLEEQVVVDDLTGLRNQRALWRELTRRVPQCSDSDPLTVVMIDFDLFKEVNEGYGHAVGDAVLRRGAAVVRRAAPSPRLAFRYGGEEFVVLLPGDEDDGRAVAERMRADIARQNGALPAVTVSCGVAQLDRPVELWVALDRADEALREAKRRGRNRVVTAEEPVAGVGAYLVDELEQETARRAALALAVATLEVRDRSTAAHCQDVLTLCEAIGRELGLDAHLQQQLVAGAQLHDVGKVGVPSEVLDKPGALTEPEWEVMRRHTITGERILRSVPEMADVATIVRHSHEHWDGSGYPDGLAGEQIPLASRIILCADAFHAIRSDRPYRTGQGAPDALREIQECAGTQFDPQVVDALVAVAADVRRRGGGAFPVPRNKRLVALLATLALGGGSAVAAIPELRDAVRSLFGAAVAPPPEVLAGDPVEGWGFGPLGDVLTIDPAAPERRRVAAPSAVPAEPRPATTRGGRERAADVGGSRGDGRSGERGELIGRGSPDRRPPSRTPGQPAPPPETGSGPAPNEATPQGGSGTQPAPAPDAQSQSEATGNGPGRGLGRDVPTPRPPAQPPGQAKDGPGRPQTPGRTDPPALGSHTGPAGRGDGGDPAARGGPNAP